uniref:hypothetical protein n=1 Tax=Thaumasiovibrio occultus TaxID=1891184 RepID=UPI000B34E536|nr:hypothetical protein [Thaumasiovibrio occultus]
MKYHRETVTIHDLPCKIRVYLPEQNTALIRIGMFFSIVGLCMLIVGCGFIVFGPDRIYYNYYEGLTFVQMLQAYPGPLATVGCLVTVLGSKLGGAEENKRQRALDDLVAKRIKIDDAEIPDGFTLSIVPLEIAGDVKLSLERKVRRKNQRIVQRGRYEG